MLASISIYLLELFAVKGFRIFMFRIWGFGLDFDCRLGVLKGF